MKITIAGKTSEVDAAVKQIESLDPLGEALFETEIKMNLMKTTKWS